MVSLTIILAFISMYAVTYLKSYCRFALVTALQPVLRWRSEMGRKGLVSHKGALHFQSHIMPRFPSMFLLTSTCRAFQLWSSIQSEGELLTVSFRISLSAGESNIVSRIVFKCSKVPTWHLCLQHQQQPTLL